MTTFNTQYKLLFFISWITCYLIFPAWALPISVSARAFVFSGLLVYFIVSAYLMNRWFNTITIEKPLITHNINWRTQLNNNSWLFILCCIAAIIHIYPLFHPILILGDEAAHLQGGLLIYDYINVSWHKIFQSMLCVVITLALIIRIFKSRLNIFFSDFVRSNLFKNISIFLFFVFLVFHFLLLKDINYTPAFVRYPPVSKFIYFLAYSAFGINHIYPRIIQLVFYLLCAVYLYRTINLFHTKETALLGASIYLFLPVSFAYAQLGELESGVICLIAINSFYFLRYIKDGDSRDLLLSSYLIGIGFLYKDPVFLVFPVCLAVLIFYQIKNNYLRSFLTLKILFLAPITVIPWMIIARLFSWRNYTFQMSNFTSLNGKMFTYPALLSANLSEPVFITLVLSAIYICIFRRNVLTVFFGLLFVVYYFFIVSDMGYLSPRFSMAFYPTIIVFLSLFISRIIQTINWKHAFTLSFIVLTMYLITISAVSPFNARFLTIEDKKLKYFPSEKAMRWVEENVKAGEKIITVRVMSSNFYRLKYGIDKNKIIDFWYEIEDISTPEKLRAFYKKNKVSYIMFPYRPEHLYIQNYPMLQYLKDNRDREFIEVEKFNLDDNFIYIYKVKGI
jgi:hypothetical protein